MNLLNVIFLGFVQGITEFLPVSSSGHLIIAREILGLQTNYGLAFDAVLQLATTLVIFVYFRKAIWSLILDCLNFLNRKTLEKQKKIYLGAILFATLPAVILGLFLEELMETAFRNTSLVAVSLIFGAFLMLVAENFLKRNINKSNQEMSLSTGLKIGFFQSLAIIPGMSRSGVTIAGGLFSGLNRENATKFSFIIALPILFGSGIKKLLDLSMAGLLSDIGFELLIGSISAFVFGFFAVHFLVNFLKNHTLKVFVWYRLILAALILIIF